MARMIPNSGPVQNDSPVAEPTIYWALQKQLDDQFTVIHSIPWLCAAVHQIDGRRAPTGETDFLILHPELGILGIEAKGGNISSDRKGLYLTHTGKRLDPLTQVKRNVFAINRVLKEHGWQFQRLGYAVAFFNADLSGRPLPSGYADWSTGKEQRITIDINDVPRIGACVEELMRYWKNVLRLPRLTKDGVERIIDVLLPTTGYPAGWNARIAADSLYLELTPQQVIELRWLEQQQRAVISGRSGTGKTLLALTRARDFASDIPQRVSGQTLSKVLFLTYNAPLTERIKNDLNDVDVDVMTFHELCRQASAVLKRPVPQEDGEAKDLWYHIDGPDNLDIAVRNAPEKLGKYVALIIDEAQVLSQTWVHSLVYWFAGKPILGCCDETQRLPFEQHLLHPQELAVILNGKVRTLTVNMRSPRRVFERLRAVLPEPEYQQLSLRPDIPDALEEIISSKPAKAYTEVIGRMRAENIPKDDIGVIYLDTVQPRIISENRSLVGRVDSVARFRGLEMPIIIVYAVTRRTLNADDDLILACAYARATTRCIVVFDPRELQLPANPARKMRFHPILLETHTHLRELLARMSPLPADPSLTPVTVSARVTWSPSMGGWLVVMDAQVASHIHNYLTRYVSVLWAAHLLLETPHPVYLISDYPYSSATYFLSPHPAVDPLIDCINTYLVWPEWCDVCNGVTPGYRAASDSPTQCLVCLKYIDNTSPVPDLAVLRQLDIVVSKPEDHLHEVRNLSPFLLVAARINQLTQAQLVELHKMLSPSLNGRMLFQDYLAEVLVKFALCRVPVGTSINANDLARRIRRASPWLEQIQEVRWINLVDRALDRFIRSSLVVGGSGQYTRAETPEQNSIRYANFDSIEQDT